MRSRSFHGIVLVLGLVIASSVRGQPGEYDSGYDQGGGYGVGTLDERVAKLEKRLSGEAMMEMLSRMDKLQSDVARLRGEVEELHHELDTVKQQQKAMYTDLEQRLPGGTSATAGSQPPAPPSEGQPPVEGEVSPAASVAPPPPAASPPPPPPPKPVVPPQPQVDAGAARQAVYQKGLTLLKDGKYPEAIREFKNFLGTNPTGENADNAVYWMGEAYYVLRDFTASRETYRRLIRDFPQSPKVADAQLKLGYIDYDTGQWAKAREQLNEVVKRYPGTNAASQASKRLAKMKQEGR